MSVDVVSTKNGMALLASAAEAMPTSPTYAGPVPQDQLQTPTELLVIVELDQSTIRPRSDASHSLPVQIMPPVSSKLEFTDADAMLTSLSADKLVFSAHPQLHGTQLHSDVSVPTPIKIGMEELASLVVLANSLTPLQDNANASVQEF